MLTQPRKRMSTLALLDPEISGGRLLDNGFWGINLAAAQLNFPDRGLKIQIPAWSSMSKSDNCKLLLDKSMVAQKTITEDIDVGERVTLFVPPLRLLSGEWELSYEVKRIGQAVEPGPVLKLFVKLELPAGQDTNPGYGHSNLSMTFDPPDVVRDGVDKDTAEEGVLVYVKPKPGNGPLYENVAVDDVITLAWAGKTVESEPVTQDNIDDPEGYPIVVLADKATILAAGDSEGVSVSYKIRDRVYNESEDWCEAVSIAVDTQNLRLGAPILEQADGLIVDLEELGDEPPRVQVWADDVNIFKQNDDIVVLVTGTTLEGTEISVTVTQRIQTTPPVRVTIEHSNSALRALAKRTAVYSYQVLRAGVPIENHQSKSRAYSVIGEPTRLAAPIALDDIGGAIDPDLTEYRVRIPYDPLITAEKMIELEWLGTRPDLTPYDPELEWFPITDDQANDPNGFVITVEDIHGKTLEGGTLKLTYFLLADEGNDMISRRPSLPASQLNVGEPQRELVKPIVLGEKDGALDPADLPGGTGKVTAPRPIAVPTQTDDVVTFFWEVEGQQPVSDFKKLNALSRDKDVVFTLNAEFVAQNIEAHRGKTVRVSYQILRAASNTTSQSNVLEFVIGEALNLKEPEIKQANGTSLDPLNAQSALTAVIDYVGMLVDDKITVTWAAAAGTPADGSHTTAPWPVATVGPQEIPLLQSVVAFNLGKLVTVSYTVSRGSGEPVPSLSLTLTVQSLQQKDLPRPEIDGMPGEVLDVHTLIDTASTRIAKWALIALGQKLWMRYFGTKADNSPYSSQTYNATPVPSAGLPNGMYPNAPVVDLRGLKDGSELKIEFKVTFDKDTTEATAQTFPVRTYTIKAVEDAAPTIDSVIGTVSGDEIAEGSETMETAVTLSGEAAKGQRVEVFDDESSVETVDADELGNWKLPLSDLSPTAHSFRVKALYGTGKISNTRTFTIKPLAIIEDFENTDSFILYPGNSHDIGSMVISHHSGDGVIRTETTGTNYPGKIEKNTLCMSGTVNSLRLDLKNDFSKVEFWYMDVHPSNSASVIFFSNQLELARKNLERGTIGAPFKISFEGIEINRIELLSNWHDVIYFDNFSFE